MRKRDDLINFTTPTDPELSIVDGRNGCFPIQKLYIWESHDHRHVYIDGIGKRGVSIKGGFRVTLECFANACRNFLDKYEDDCKINAEGFCQTHEKVHLRERAAAMEVPAGELSLSTALELVQRAAWIVNAKAEGETDEKRQGSLTSVYYDLGRLIGSLNCLIREDGGES